MANGDPGSLSADQPAFVDSGDSVMRGFTGSARTAVRFPPLLLLPLLLAACGPDEVISDLPSPNGQYHVEVRKCPQPGSLTWTEMTQVSVLASGISEKCQSAVNALVQFDGAAPDDQLQLEWISDTELRAWHPAFNPEYGPATATHKHDAPVKVIYSPGK